MPVLRAAWAAWTCKAPGTIARGVSRELAPPRTVYQLDSYGRIRATRGAAGKSRSKTP
jgi:hypothetical protein